MTMGDPALAGRTQFAFTVMFHYLFPALTMGLASIIALLKTMQYVTKNELCGQAANFWAKIFAANFAMGVVTGIPMEFQFGTNWANFSRFSGNVIGQTLSMEGTYAFFLESGFLGVFLFMEKRVPPFVHWLSSILVAFGTLLSGYFIVMTDAWMQHPVGYQLLPGGKVALVSLMAVLTNPYGVWQYWHTINGSFVTAAVIVAGTGAYYLLARRDEQFGRLFVKLGVAMALFFSVTQLFPTGAKQAERLAEFQPIKTAAMEGLYHTQVGAPLAIIGMPDSKNEKLLDPVVVPGALSFLAYGHTNARVAGIDSYPTDQIPPVEVVYYAYHIMVGIGTLMMGVFGLGALLLWRGKLMTSRWYLWIVMLCMPFPYIANEAGWCVAEVGRQPWVTYGLMRTAVGISPNVSSGETIFTLLGFMGLYALIGLLFLWTLIRIIGAGPSADTHESHTGGNGVSPNHIPIDSPAPELVGAGGTAA